MASDNLNECVDFILRKEKQDYKKLGSDNQTLRVIRHNASGKAKVFGNSGTINNAYFLYSDATKQPEQFTVNAKVIWNNGEQAVAAYEISSSVNGAGNFNVSNFNFAEASGGKAYWWFIDNGMLTSKLQ